MEHKYRGLFVLINNKKIDRVTLMPERTGTDADAANLEQLFKKLGFKVQIHRDKTRIEMIKIMNEGKHPELKSFYCCG